MVEYVSKKNKSRTSFYKIYNKTGGASVRISKAEFLKKGGSIDIVKQWSGPNDSAPEPLLNGGLYTGESFKGPWGNYPVAPTTNGFMANLASANPPPGALDQFPGYVRLGNNFQVNPSKDFSNETMIKCTGGAKKSKSKKTNKSTKSNKKGGFFNYLLGSGDKTKLNQTSTQTTAQPTSNQTSTSPSNQTSTPPSNQTSTPPSNQTTAQPPLLQGQEKELVQRQEQEQVANEQVKSKNNSKNTPPSNQTSTPPSNQTSTPPSNQTTAQPPLLQGVQRLVQEQGVQGVKEQEQEQEQVQGQVENPLLQKKNPSQQAGGKSKKKSSKPSKKPVNKYKSASYL